MNRMLVALALAGVTVGTLSACGSAATGSSGSSGTPTASTSTSGTAATGTPIVFGTNGSDQGNGYNQFQFQDGFEAWAKQVSANGGIGGHPVTIKRCNDQATPTQSATCARQQIADTSIIASMGFTPYSGFVSGPAYQAAKMAYVAPYPVSSADFSVLPAVTTPGTLGAFTGLTNYLAQHGYNKFGVIRTDVSATESLVSEVKGGLVGTSASFGADIPTPAATTDYSSAISQAIADKVDVLLLGVQTSAVVPIFKAAKSQGYTGAFGIPGTSLAQTDVAQGQASTGVKVFADSDFPDASSSSIPAIVNFRAAMSAAGYGQSEIDPAALSGYETGLLFEQVVKQVGPNDVTRASFLSELSSADITGVPQFPASAGSGTAPTNARPVINPVIYVIQIIDGKTQTITGAINLKTVIENVKF